MKLRPPKMAEASLLPKEIESAIVGCYLDPEVAPVGQ